MGPNYFLLADDGGCDHFSKVFEQISAAEPALIFFFVVVKHDSIFLFVAMECKACWLQCCNCEK